MTKILGASWQTSIFGWIALITAATTYITALLDGDPSTIPNWETITIAATGVGLIKARDNKVTSEQVKAG